MKNKSKLCSTGHGTGVRARASVLQMIEATRSIKSKRRKKYLIHQKEMRAREQTQRRERLKKSLEQSHIVFESGSSIKLQGPVTEEMKSGLEIHEESER